MPVVRRWITVRAATVTVSWPKIRMKIVGVVASAVRVTNWRVSSRSKEKSVRVMSALSPKFASKYFRATASASSLSATRPAARPAVSSDFDMRAFSR